MSLGAVLLLLGVILTAVVASGLSFPLEGMRQGLVKALSDGTGREVRIDGGIRLYPSLRPALSIDRVVIGNPVGWDGEMLRADVARVQIALIPLLLGRVDLYEVAASGVEIELVQRLDGDNNWRFDGTSPTGDSMETPPPGDRKSEPSAVALPNVNLYEFRLADVNVRYHDEKLGRSFDDRLERLDLTRRTDDRFSGQGRGDADGIPYSFELEFDRLRQLFAGEPWHLEASGRIGKRELHARTGLTLRNGQLSGSWSLNLDSADIGRLVSWLGLGDGIDARTDKMQMTATLAGSNLEELLSRSSFNLDFVGGEWRIKRGDSDEPYRIALDRVYMTSAADSPLQLTVAGGIDGQATHLSIMTTRLIDLLRKDAVDLTLEAELLGTRIELTGKVPLPIAQQEFTVDMQISGDRLDRWKALLDSNLPPYGPYTLAGHFQFKPGVLRVKDIKVTVGDSDLEGMLEVDTDADTPLWTLALKTRQLQIDDFRTGEWSLRPGAARTGISSETRALKSVDNALQTYVDDERSREPILFDLDVQAGDVRLGQEHLGGGRLVMHQRRAWTEVEQLTLDLPAGQIDASARLEESGGGIQGWLKLFMERLDYGILARQIDPQTKAAGHVSMNVDVTLGGPDIARLMHAASGRFDLVVWPENLSSNVFDIWATNLLFALLPRLSEKESRFNCLTGVFDLEGGRMREQVLAIDTSKVLFEGQAEIDFTSERVSLYLKPLPKRPKIFALEMPIRLAGNFDDFGLDLRLGDLAKTSFVFLTSPLHAPLRRALHEVQHGDGGDLCRRLYDRDFLEQLKAEQEAREPTLDEMYDAD